MSILVLSNIDLNLAYGLWNLVHDIKAIETSIAVLGLTKGFSQAQADKRAAFYEQIHGLIYVLCSPASLKRWQDKTHHIDWQRKMLILASSHSVWQIKIAM